MIKHIVMWKLKKEFDEQEKQDKCKFIKQRLEELKYKIEDIIDIKIGINDYEAPEGNFDIVLEVLVDDFSALKRYANNPIHLKAIEVIKQLVEKRVAVDFKE